jgi:hypothetical protein
LLLASVLCAIVTCLDAELSRGRVQHPPPPQLPHETMQIISHDSNQPYVIGHVMQRDIAKNKSAMDGGNIRLGRATHRLSLLPCARRSSRCISPSVQIADGRSTCLLSEVSSEGFSEPSHFASKQGGVERRASRARQKRGKRAPWAADGSCATRWLDFETAKSTVRLLEHTRRSDFWEWWKRERPVDLPYNPDKAYRKSGWSSWGDFLGLDENSSGYRWR